MNQVLQFPIKLANFDSVIKVPEKAEFLSMTFDESHAYLFILGDDSNESQDWILKSYRSWYEINKHGVQMFLGTAVYKSEALHYFLMHNPKDQG